MGRKNHVNNLALELRLLLPFQPRNNSEIRRFQPKGGNLALVSGFCQGEFLGFLQRQRP
jgi:hypothetical protein